MVFRSFRKKTTSSRGTLKPDGEVPGLTDNPKTNLVMADIAFRAGSYVLRSIVEKRILKGRYDHKTAARMLKNRPLTQTLTSVAIAKVATRSIPGAAIVSTGILAKTLYDRGKSRRDAKREGDAALLDQADD